MIRIDIMILLGLLCFWPLNVNAQSSDALIGKWEAVYEEEGEKATVTYEFSEENGKLVCHTICIKDDNGEEGDYNSIAMKNIRFEEGMGQARYMYKEDDKIYEMKAYLELKSPTSLKVSYSYWGFSETENWKRVE